MEVSVLMGLASPPPEWTGMRWAIPASMMHQELEAADGRRGDRFRISWGRIAPAVPLHVIDLPTPAVGPGCSDQALFAGLDEFGE